MTEGRRRLTLASALLLALGTAFAADPPDSRVNPRTGHIETTDAFWASGNYNVRYTASPGEGQPPTTHILSTDPADDLDPRITSAPSGDVWVVWWRNGAGGPSVWIRQRSFASGAWGSERRVGESSESARKPRIVWNGTAPWVAYEIATGSALSVAVQSVLEGSDPFPSRAIIGSSALTSGADVQIHSESGRTWVDWIDDATFVAWSEYDAATGAWSVEAHDSYAADSVEAARARIRAEVLD